MLDLRRDGDVFILTMQSGENRFNRPFVQALNAALDEVEASTGPAALVTVGQDKFFSNGLDLTWMAGDGASEGFAFVDDVIKVLGRFLALPVVTAAAMNGHTFAAGAMLALAHDYRVMRVDRGFFCLPEVDIKIPFAPGMTALIKERFGPKLLRETILTGARIGGSQAAQLGIVDEAVAADEVLARAVALVAPLAAKDRATLGALKRGMYADTLRIMLG